MSAIACASASGSIIEARAAGRSMSLAAIHSPIAPAWHARPPFGERSRVCPGSVGSGTSGISNQRGRLRVEPLDVRRQALLATRPRHRASRRRAPSSTRPTSSGGQRRDARRTPRSVGPSSASARVAGSSCPRGARRGACAGSRPRSTRRDRGFASSRRSSSPRGCSRIDSRRSGTDRQQPAKRSPRDRGGFLVRAARRRRVELAYPASATHSW